MERLKKFDRVIVWGLKTIRNSHGYIHESYYNAFKKNNIYSKTYWTDDAPEYQDVVIPNSLIFIWEFCKEYLPIRDDCFYICHACQKNFLDIKPENKIHLMTYMNMVDQPGLVKLEEVCYFFKPWQMLYQPWGTDLEPEEFCRPTYNHYSKVVNWVGSIWKDSIDVEYGGNLEVIDSLKNALIKNDLKFVHATNTGYKENIILVRESRIAPAVAGKRQVMTNYLPCRMFKNISYGQLGFSNVEHFKVLYPDCVIVESDIDLLIDRALSVGEKDYKDLVKIQQEFTKRYTYSQNIKRILDSIDILRGV